jgi:hypothetical protein
VGQCYVHLVAIDVKCAYLKSGLAGDRDATSSGNLITLFRSQFMLGVMSTNNFEDAVVINGI